MRVSEAIWGKSWAIAVVVVLLVSTGQAWAQSSQRIKDQILKKHRDAMASYDDFAFEEAKKLLEEAVALAEQNGLDRDPFLARVHLDLGVVYFSGLQDRASAEQHFTKAVEIDPQIEIDAAYGSSAMQELLLAAKRRAGAQPAQPGGEPAAPGEQAQTVDCNAILGIEHRLIDSARAGEDLTVEAYVSARLGAAQVLLHFRPRGMADASPDFSQVKMDKTGDCKYTGRIPGHAIRGTMVHYYIAAHNRSGKIMAGRGSASAPNIMEVVAGEPGSTTSDRDNPLAELTADAAPASQPSAPSRVLVSVTTGMGGAYVSGETEQMSSPINCCVAPELLHLRIEGGYRLTPQLGLSLAFRLGFPIGANLQNHATAAPAGLVRLRHWLDPSGNGLQVSAALGGGLIRQTVQIANGSPGMDTDTAAVGPVLVGGGVGYAHPLAGPVRLVAEAGVLLGLPVVGELGTSKPQFGFHLDLDLGVEFAF